MSAIPAKAQEHSETSKAAAIAIESMAVTLRGEVYRFLLSRGEHGATDDEMQRFMYMNPSTQRPRRIELVEKGLVKDSGETRPTRSRRAAAVWIAINPEEGE